MLRKIEGLYSDRLGSLRDSLGCLCALVYAIVAIIVVYRVIVIVACVDLPCSATNYTDKDLELSTKSKIIF